MKLLALPDLHARTAVLNPILDLIRQADLVLLCGDITHFGHAREMENILQFVQGYNPSVLAVSGNCDYPDAERYLMEKELSLHGTFRKFTGHMFLGLSGSLPCPGKTPHEYSEEEYDALLQGLSVPDDEPLILVSHQPPYGTVTDQVTPNVHVGSKAIRAFIEKQQPMLCFTGHIHEGIGQDRIGETIVVNPGPAGHGAYTWAEISGGKIINLDISQPLSG